MRENSWISTAFDRLVRLGSSASMLAVAAMMFIVSYMYIFRLFHQSLSWGFDVVEFLIVGIAFLPAAEVLSKDRHIRVQVVLQHAPEKVRRILMAMGYGAGLLYTSVLAWQGLQLALRSMSRHEVSIGGSGMPLFIPQLFIPVGCGLFGLMYGVKLVRVIRRSPESGNATRENA